MTSTKTCALRTAVRTSGSVWTRSKVITASVSALTMVCSASPKPTQIYQYTYTCVLFTLFFTKPVVQNN